jgi:DNA-binding MarR family transcriptional regulator
MGVTVVSESSSQLSQEIILDVFRAANLLGRIGGKIAVQAGLASVQQWIILGTIDAAGEVALKELSANTLVTKQNITGLVDRLRSGGYVSTRVDPDDKRSTLVRLTPKGEEVLAVVRPLAAASNRETFAGFAEGELRQLSELMSRLVDSLQRPGTSGDNGKERR